MSQRYIFWLMALFLGGTIVIYVTVLSVKTYHYRQALEQAKGLEVSAKPYFSVVKRMTLQMPDFIIHTIDGGQKKISDFRGKYVVLNIWATWCMPCLKELPALKTLKTVMEPDGVSVLAVAYDFTAKDDKIKKFAEKYGVAEVAGYYFDAEDSSVGDLIKDMPGLPITYIINPQGWIVLGISGDAQWDRPDIIAFLKELKLGG